MTTAINIQSANPLADPTILALTGNQSVPSDARYIVRVSSNDPSWILTVPSGKSHRIQNAGANEFRVAYTTGSVGVPVGSEVEVIWSSATSQHLVQITTSAAFDAVITGTSENAPQTKIIKSYVDTAVAGVPGSSSAEVRAAAWPMAILIERAGAIVYDGSNANATTAGTNFKTALGLLQAGDTMICGPGTFNLINAEVDASDVEIICHGTRLRTNANYDWVFRVNGNRVKVYGLKVDGGEDANNPPLSNNAWGFYIRGNDVELHDCEDFGVTAQGLYGGGLFVWEGFRFRSFNYRSEKASYASFILTDAVDAKLFDTVSINPKNRTGAVRTLRAPGVPLDKGGGNMVTWRNVTIDGLFAYMGETSIGAAAFPHINFDVYRETTGQRVEEAVVRRAHFKAEDIYNDATNNGAMKFQAIDRVILDDVLIENYANAGSGEIRAFTVESTSQEAIKELYCRNVRASGHVVGNSTPFDKATFDDCHFGLHQCEGGVTVRTFFPAKLVVRNSSFNYHAGSRAFDTPSPLPAGFDWSFENNTFKGDKSTTLYIFLGTALAGAGGRFRFDKSNTIANNGAGIISPSHLRPANLIATTDRQGDMLWDADIAASSGSYNVHPEPGAGPNYFPDLTDAVLGTRIWNVKKLTTGSAFPTCWQWDGTNWKSLIA